MKFTFARANTAKLLRLPFYAIGGSIALCWPRQRLLWVFGRKTGVGEGPLRLLHEAKATYPELRMVWIAQDAGQLDEARALGLEAYPKSSWRARWLTLRAGVGVVTHGFGDLCRPFVPGMYLVQLWHGSPLKRIHLDAAQVHRTTADGMFGQLAARVVASMLRASAYFIRCLPSPSPLVSSRFRSAWGWSNSERIRLTGDPRCDVLLDGDSPGRREHASGLLRSLWRVSALPGRLILFAPTWRDGEADPSLPDRAQLRQIETMLTARNAWLVIRSHPWGTGTEDAARTDGMRRVRFLPSTELNDINRVLNAVDVLITDYSAIAMDYSLLLRPIVFFAPDLDAYRRTRGLYEPYEDFTGGAWHSGWDGVTAALDTILGSEDAFADAARRTAAPIMDRYHHYRDAHSTRRLIAHIAGAVGLARESP
jgi:CDP-glycerol glycerophosphotransferase (TagB/SpsB family)